MSQFYSFRSTVLENTETMNMCMFKEEVFVVYYWFVHRLILRMKEKYSYLIREYDVQVLVFLFS
jgi:hypothetical protein